jgi:ABC-type amino acid transport substrate-binding protein
MPHKNDRFIACHLITLQEIFRMWTFNQRPAAAMGSAGGVSRRHSLGMLLALGVAPAFAEDELDDLAKIRARGTLKVAVYKDNAPFSSGAVSDMTGLDVALAQGLARQLKLKLALLPFDAGENMNDDLRNMVWKGHYLGYGPADVMLNVPVDKYLMQQNRQVTIFSPYMRQMPVLFHRASKLPQVNDPSDLTGHTLAAERGTGAASALLGHNSGLLSAQVTLFNSGMDAATAVLQGQVEAAYVLRSQAEAATAQSKAKPEHFVITPLRLTGLPDNGWPLGMAIKSNYKDLGQALDAAMQALRDNGELLAMFKSRGLTLTAP